jgi:3-hydroxyisobutyrate dehydrogenase-like beta-hydroxyacid dehydrogenase
VHFSKFSPALLTPDFVNTNSLLGIPIGDFAQNSDHFFMTVSLIGYGEAARAFTKGGLAALTAYDIDPARRDGVAKHAEASAALAGATVVLSLVTADQALTAAQTYANLLAPDALYCDMNSVAPETKRAAAEAIHASGGRYVDVAIMAPVYPKQMDVPLLVSGPHAEDGAAALRAAGFDFVRIVGDSVGKASAIKMIRSVMIKGIEALTAEMMLAARAGHVEDEVLASLGDGWADRADYNLERMTTHGLRRAAEMEESAKTLAALGIDPVMTRGTIIRQREMAA